LNDEIKVFVGRKLIDGTGTAPLGNAVILVESQKIAAIGERGEVDIPKGAKTIDVVGKTIIPGLFDLHAHFAPFTDAECLEGMNDRVMGAAMCRGVCTGFW